MVSCHLTRRGLESVPLWVISTALLLSLVPGRALAAVPDNAGATAQALLSYANAERSSRGLGALSRSGSLDRTAQSWAEHLASEGRMYHMSDPARGSGFNWRGENLAYWQGSPGLSAETMHRQMWMPSRSHRDNILHSGFTHMGVGAACQFHDGVPWIFVVVHFGGPSGPVQNSSSGSVSGNGSTPLLTCGGDSAPPAPPPAPLPPPAAPAGASDAGSGDGDDPVPTDNSAGRLIQQLKSDAAEPEPAPSKSARSNPAAPPDPDTGNKQSAKSGSGTSSTSAGPVTEPAEVENATGEPSPPGQLEEVKPEPAGGDGDLSPAADGPNRIEGTALGATEETSSPLWIATGIFGLALALSVQRRRPRWTPRHATKRSLFLRR